MSNKRFVSFPRKRKSIIDFISLSNPKSRVIIFGIILLILALLPYNILISLPSLSVYQNLGIPAYSIGETRALSMILHGDFIGAWEMNKLAYLIIGVVIGLLIKDILYLSRDHSRSN